MTNYVIKLSGRLCDVCEGVGEEEREEVTLMNPRQDGG